MDTEVKQTVRKIFNNLRKQHGIVATRKSDRVDVDTILRSYQSRGTNFEPKK